MKKFLAIVLMVCYAASASGMAFSLNFCNNALSYISLDANVETECCCSGETNSDCCEKEMVIMKKADEHQRCSSVAISEPLDSPIKFPFHYHYEPLVSVHHLISARNVVYLQPLKRFRSVALYIFHSVYRV